MPKRKMSVALSDEVVEVIDREARTKRLRSRSAVIEAWGRAQRRAIELDALADALECYQREATSAQRAEDDQIVGASTRRARRIPVD